MQYLVLKRFESFGKFFKKGDVVDESMIRSPRIRRSEGKIVPAVSSFSVPVELGSEGPAPQDGFRNEDKEPEVAQAASKAQEKPKIKLSHSK